MSCEICGKSINLKSCGRCLKVTYCSREHQIADWKSHKRWCNKSSTMENLISNNGHSNNNGTSSNNVIANETSTEFRQQTDPVNHFMNQSVLDYHSLPNSSNQINGSTNSRLKDFAPQNIPISQSSQICPSIASLKVCDLSDPNLKTSYSDVSPPPNSFNSNTIPSQFTQNRESVFNNLDTYCQIVLRDMNQYGFCVIDNFLQNGEAILSEVYNLYHRGLFRAGQVVNTKANSNSKLIRGDQIIWIEGNEQICSNIGFLIRILDSVVTRCNSTIPSGEFLKYKINRRTKAMIACYPGNYAKYVRHIDNPNNDGRCITSIYYLNKEYNRQEDGGVLRLFPQMNDGSVADIEPKFNRVIFFWSDRRNPHEVMPSTRMRFAITVWYFDANERAKAIQKYKENSMQCPNDTDLAPF